ncbi:MAG: hypothetical protein JWL77_6172 [Chthonomonadaceae bacterium]|nr:hypothetical protein [Chthonomonadaceae bacterium]
MERSLLWGVFAMGWVSWLLGLAAARARQTGTGRSAAPLPRAYLVAAVVLPLLVFVATLPSQGKFFAVGQGLGKGFLLGGVCALLAAWTPLLAGEGSDIRRRIGGTVAAPCGMALVAAVTPLLMIRGSLLDTLMGSAIGWFCITMLVLLGMLQQNEGETERPGVLAILVGTGFAILTCAVAALGEMRGTLDLTATSTVSWSVLGMVFAAGVPLALLLSGVLNAGLTVVFGLLPGMGGVARAGETILPDALSRNTALRLWRIVLASVILLVLGKLLSGRVVDDDSAKLALHIFQVMALGLFGGAAAWWVTSSARRLERESPGNAGAVAWQNNAVAALLLLAGVMVAFQMLAGFGVGLLLIGAWLAVSLSAVFAQEPEVSEATGAEITDTPAVAANLLRLGLMGVALLLYRVFSSRFESELRGVSLTDQYAAFGLILGAMLPGLLTGFLLRPFTETTAPAPRIARLCVVALLVLAVPALVLILWGTKCALALILGLALSITLLPSATVPGTPSKEALSSGLRLLPTLFALGVCLALAQWTHHILPLTELTRADKESLTLKLMALLAVLILIADYSGRFAGWMRSRRQGTPVLPTEGAVR